MEGTSYTVEEADYSSEGYVKKSTGETGIISKDTASVAHFTNTYNIDESNGGSKDPEDPDNTTSSKSSVVPKYKTGEVPDPNGKDAPAKTGDSMPLIPIIAVTLIAVVGAMVLFLYKRKIFGYYYDS